LLTYDLCSSECSGGGFIIIFKIELNPLVSHPCMLCCRDSGSTLSKRTSFVFSFWVWTTQEKRCVM